MSDRGGSRRPVSPGGNGDQPPHGVRVAPVELDPGVLDLGLRLAMEWGAELRKPIQPRLGRVHPELTAAQLDRYDGACRAAMERGHALVGELLAELQEPPSDAVFERFSERMLAQWPWISRESLGRLYSQGCYYAMK